MIDEIAEFCQEYHIVAFGIGGIVLAFLVEFFLRRCDGEWFWTKSKPKPRK